MPEHFRAKLDTMQCLLEKIVSKAGFVCVYDGSSNPETSTGWRSPRSIPGCTAASRMGSG